MNVSQANVTIVINYQDSFAKAVTKNVIVVVLSISINYINAGLIHTFSKHQIFYTNPRYVLFVNLVVNDMVQLSLTVSLFIVSYVVLKVPVTACVVLTLIALLLTENTPLILACMALECYVAVCIPLHHAQICTIRRTQMLIGFIWTISVFSVLPDLFMNLVLEPLDFFNSRVFCVREFVFRNLSITERRNITYIVYLVLVWCVIFYTYIRILFTARAASKDAKKARNTIILHGFQLLLCMTIYIEPLVKQVLLQWFRQQYADSLFGSYIVFQMLPRFLSPVVYGIRDPTFRKYLKRYLACKMRTHKNQT